MQNVKERLLTLDLAVEIVDSDLVGVALVFLLSLALSDLGIFLLSERLGLGCTLVHVLFVLSPQSLNLLMIVSLSIEKLRLVVIGQVGDPGVGLGCDLCKFSLMR